MLRPADDVQVFLYTGHVDMRKSINGLSAMVEQELELNPMMQALFVFCNRGRDKVKLLYWERNGFVLWYKRLEKQRFTWIKTNDAGATQLSGYALNLLLDGLDIFNNQPHQTLYYRSVN